MAQKPSIPKGTRDFSPIETARRSYIFDTIAEVFRNYGFASIETPSMENLSTLMGKYGEEGDKLLFKILNSGDFGANLNDEEVRQAHRICEKIPLIFTGLKLRAITIPNENGNNILSRPPKKFAVSSVQPIPIIS